MLTATVTSYLKSDAIELNKENIGKEDGQRHSNKEPFSFT